MTEVDLARIAVGHFAPMGEIFPEVTGPYGGGRADFVVRYETGFLDVVECKTHPTKQLERQADYWKMCADRVWVAYEPPSRGALVQAWAERFFRRGIGVLEITGGTAFVRRSPARCCDEPDWVFRHYRRRLEAMLIPELKGYAEPGNAESKYLSPFRYTCDQLRYLVSREPGVTMRAAVERISHHYSSDKVARASLMQWCQKGKVRGVQVRPVDGCRALGLYPKQEVS